MPRAIKDPKEDPRYFSHTTTLKVQPNRTDRMLLVAVILSALVTLAGFLFAVAHFFAP